MLFNGLNLHAIPAPHPGRYCTGPPTKMNLLRLCFRIYTSVFRILQRRSQCWFCLNRQLWLGTRNSGLELGSWTCDDLVGMRDQVGSRKYYHAPYRARLSLHPPPATISSDHVQYLSYILAVPRVLLCTISLYMHCHQFLSVS